MEIRRAERKKAKLRLGICGPTGSGKTWSALEIAHGMGGKIGMIDTESGRGELYADGISKHNGDTIFKYDIIRLDAPFSPDRYIEAIKKFEKAGYDILIIDSLSHAWSGDGGVLSIVDKAGANSFTNGWRTGTPKQNALVDAIITSKMHVITTLRVKTEYVVEKNDRGKAEPRKIGLSPVQRDGLEYEFTIFMDMNQEHIAHVTKDNTNMYDQEYLKPGPNMGEKIMEWLNRGADEQDIFVKNLLPEIINNIKAVDDLSQLKDAYKKAYNDYAEKFPEAFEKVTLAKDERKAELLDEDIAELPAIEDVVLQTQAKNTPIVRRTA